MKVLAANAKKSLFTIVLILEQGTECVAVSSSSQGWLFPEGEQTRSQA